MIADLISTSWFRRELNIDFPIYHGSAVDTKYLRHVANPSYAPRPLLIDEAKMAPRNIHNGASTSDIFRGDLLRIGIAKQQTEVVSVSRAILSSVNPGKSKLNCGRNNQPNHIPKQSVFTLCDDNTNAGNAMHHARITTAACTLIIGVVPARRTLLRLQD